MPILDSPKIDYMPSYIDALYAGFYRGVGKPKTEEEILSIKKNPQETIDNFSKPKPPTWTNEYGVEILRVPATTLWYVDKDTFIGEVSIRHELNDYLLNRGGHIGYGVRPDMKNQGHGTEMTKLAIEFCKNKLSLNKIMISVDDSNISSVRVIEKNGGILEDIRIDGLSNTPFRRYWITL